MQQSGIAPWRVDFILGANSLRYIAPYHLDNR